MLDREDQQGEAESEKLTAGVGNSERKWVLWWLTCAGRPVHDQSCSNCSAVLFREVSKQKVRQT